MCRQILAFAREETFGPVASIEVVDDADAAVERANATGYGLAAGIITSDNQRGFELAGRIEAGIVHVNDQTAQTFGEYINTHEGNAPLRVPFRADAHD